MKKRAQNNMRVCIEIQNVSKMRIPPHHLLKAAAVLTLSATSKVGIQKKNGMKNKMLCIRMVNEAESAMLNQQYRKKSGPTNVLAFPIGLNELGLLGDLVICPAIVKKEAHSQNKTLAAHFSHIVVHGTLHLLGFDHQTNKEALEMESLEIKFLQQLGFSNPYLLRDFA